MRSQTQRLRRTTKGSRPEELDFQDWGALKVEKKLVNLRNANSSNQKYKIRIFNNENKL